MIFPINLNKFLINYYGVISICIEIMGHDFKIIGGVV